MAGIGGNHTTYHYTVLSYNDSPPSVSWTTTMFPVSRIEAWLVWALALHQCLCHAEPMVTMYVRGVENDFTDIPSRSLNSCWRYIYDKYFLVRFSCHFPLPQGAFWNLFQHFSRFTTIVTLELQMRQIPMDAWQQLPQKGEIIGTSGTPTTNHWGLTLTYATSLSLLKSRISPALMDGLGRAFMVEDIKSCVIAIRAI